MFIIGTPQPIEETGDIDDTYSRTTMRQYYVYASVDSSVSYVRSNLGIGIYGNDPSEPGTLVKGISVKRSSKKSSPYPVDNPGNATYPPAAGTKCYQWIATVTWGPWNPLEHTPTGNFIDQPVQVFTETVKYEDICDVDVNGNPVLNKAGDYFDPPVTFDATRFLIRVVRNEPTFSVYSAAGYIDKLNYDAIGSFSPGQLKCESVRGTPKFSQFDGVVYYEVEYVFATSLIPTGWKKVVLNQGYREIVPGTTTKRRTITMNGLPITTPGLLDASGHYLQPPVSSSNVVFLAFDVYFKILYGSFGFPAGVFA